MPTFINPDRTGLPPLQDSNINPGLEALTGADICVSRFPLPVTEDTLQTHIKYQSLFVQIKIGYDACSFDALKAAIARMQAQKIPKGKAVLLCIGSFYSDEDGLLRIVNSRPYGKTRWDDFLMAMELWEARGGIYSLNVVRDISELQSWIDRKFKRWEKIEREGSKKVYINQPPLVFEGSDIWQPVEEVDKNSPDYFIYGLNGCGPQIIENIKEYMTAELSHLPIDGFYLLKIMTDENEKGKAIHNVKGIGDGLRKRWRGILGLPDGVNLGIIGTYEDGWYTGLKTFKGLVESKKLTATEAFNATMALIKKEVIKLPTDEVPF